MASCYIAGTGIHTCLGQGTTANVAALRQPPPLPQTCTVDLGKQSVDIRCHRLNGLSQGDAEHRLTSAVFGVVEEAIDAAGLTHKNLEDAALVVGTSSIDISVSEAIYCRELEERSDAEPMTGNIRIGQLADRMRQRFGIRGQDLTINTACTASANALVYGDRLIRSGRAKSVIVVGVEVFNLITAMGFSSLDLLTPTQMKPFDRERNGLALGEGCSALVLSDRLRGSAPIQLAGSANLCDTHGISTANPDGSTVAQVIRGALDDARLQPSQIEAIKTHGTASLLNDESEAAGLHQLFSTLPPVCAMKPFIGHTFGACGLNELILFLGAAEARFLPGTPGICAERSDLDIVLTQAPQPLDGGYYLLNYFGFGGNNTALILSHDR